MTGRSREAESALVLLRALDLLEAAASEPTKDAAVRAVQVVTRQLTPDELRRVVVALAVEAVWDLPPADRRPRSGVDVRERLARVRAWVRRVRLEATWAAS